MSGMSDEIGKRVAELSRCTATPDELLARLDDAITIAKCGGIEPRTLEALLHLGATRAMTPTTKRVLNAVGIDTTPWEDQ